MNFKHKIKLSIFTLLMISTSVATAGKGIDFLYGVGVAGFGTQDNTNILETDATLVGEFIVGFEEAGFAVEFGVANSLSSGTSNDNIDYQAAITHGTLAYRTIEKKNRYYKFKYGKMNIDWDFTGTTATADTSGNVFGLAMGIRSAKDTRMELEYNLYSSSDVDTTHMIVLRYIFGGTSPETGFK
jgi:hypothetical protein